MSVKIKIALSVLISFFYCAEIQAAGSIAKISAIKGKILLNQGQHYARAEGDEVLPLGSQILISEKSSVSIFYAEAKCTVTYSAPATIKVAAKAPCKSDEQVASLRGSFAVLANGGSAAMMAGSPVIYTTPVIVGLSFTSAVFLLAAATDIFPVSAP